MDLGENPTNYFFSLETRNYTSKVIDEWIDEDIEYTKTKKVYLMPVKTQLLQFTLTGDVMLFYHSN